MDAKFPISLTRVKIEGMDPLMDTPDESGDHAYVITKDIFVLIPPLGVVMTREWVPLVERIPFMVLISVHWNNEFKCDMTLCVSNS